MNKQSSKGKSSIIPNITEYLVLHNFLCTVPCIAGFDINTCPLSGTNKKNHGQVNIGSTCPTGQVIIWSHWGRSCLKILSKTRKYFAVIDDLIVCQSKTEAVRNVDTCSQNEIADLIGIEVHYNHFTFNSCKMVFLQRAKTIRNVKW